MIAVGSSRDDDGEGGFGAVRMLLIVMLWRLVFVTMPMLTAVPADDGAQLDEGHKSHNFEMVTRRVFLPDDDDYVTTTMRRRRKQKTMRLMIMMMLFMMMMTMVASKVMKNRIEHIVMMNNVSLHQDGAAGADRDEDCRIDSCNEQDGDSAGDW